MNSRQRRKLLRSLEQPRPTQPPDSSERLVQKQLPPAKQLRSELLMQPSKWQRCRKKLLRRIGLPTTLFGIATLLLSFFPHLEISTPITMNPDQLMSKYMTITNDGILPVFSVKCGVPINQMFSNNESGLADLTIIDTSCEIGRLSPGDGYTFSPEHLFNLPANQTKMADFEISISYIPILPPVRMQKCIHFCFIPSI